VYNDPQIMRAVNSTSVNS